MDASHLNDVPLLSELSRRQRKAVAQHADELDLAEGTTLVEQGRLAYELFIIVSGTVDVFEDAKKIRELGPGDVIGEIGVLETHKRTATVVATSPVRAIVISAPELRAMTSSYPDVDAQLRQLISERPH